MTTLEIRLGQARYFHADMVRAMEKALATAKTPEQVESAAVVAMEILDSLNRLAGQAEARAAELRRVAGLKDTQPLPRAQDLLDTPPRARRPFFFDEVASVLPAPGSLPTEVQP